MKKSNYCQALLNGVIIQNNKKETRAIVKNDNSVVFKTRNKKEYEQKTNVFINIPLIRGSLILMNYLISFLRSLNDSAEFIEKELDKKDNNKKISQKYDLYFIDILTLIAILFSLIFSFLCLIIVPSILIYFFNKIIIIPFLNSLLEGICRLIIFYLMLVITSKIPKIKNMYMYHGAFHKISQCYEDGLPLTMENINKYNAYSSKCGLSFMFNTLFACIILFSIIQIVNPGILNTFNRITYMFMISGVLYEIMLILNNKNKSIFIGKIFQETLVKEPTNEILLIVKKAFDLNLENQEKGEKHEREI